MRTNVVHYWVIWLFLLSLNIYFLQLIKFPNIYLKETLAQVVKDKALFVITHCPPYF